ncbi:MAG: cation-translocating P-type ATPase, partial [Bacteroidota bacterium]
MSTKELTHISLQVRGMTCSSCAMGVEKYLKKEGLDEVMVDFAHGEVNFKQDKKKKIDNIIEGIEKLGFEVLEEESAEEVQGLSKLEKRFYISAFFTFPLLLHMFISWHVLHNHWVQLALCIPVFMIGMWHFGRSGWKSLQTGAPSMDVLIAIGALTAFGYSLYGSLTNAGPDFLFYETAASVVTLVLLGNLLEERSVKKTTSAIQELKQFQVKEANRLRMQDGQEYLEKVSLEDIRIGDVLQVNTGDRIPLDGSIIAGRASIDESMISGESLPLEKGRNDSVIGGTFLLEGNLQLRVSATEKDSTLAKIIALVKGAQKDKPQIQRLGDQISAVFVPVVLGISLLTFGFSFWVFDLGLKAAIIHSIAVLVISCPCAMGLATPTAVMVGIGRASKQGILIKGGRSLEKFSQIKRIVFDKTGTLTDGSFKISQINCVEEDRREV